MQSVPVLETQPTWMRGMHADAAFEIRVPGQLEGQVGSPAGANRSVGLAIEALAVRKHTLIDIFLEFHGITLVVDEFSYLAIPHGECVEILVSEIICKYDLVKDGYHVLRAVTLKGKSFTALLF